LEILLTSLEETARLVGRMGGVMFLSLFGVELLMQLGMMKYLRPVGQPVARLARLPSESALSFLSAIGSMIAAHTMTAQHFEDRRLTRRELTATGVLNTVPFHFKETFTFQLPVVLPLLGPRLCLVYIAAFWLTGVIKIIFVVLYGQLAIPPREEQSDAFAALACNPDQQGCGIRTVRQLLTDTWNKRRRMFARMLLVLAVVTLLVQLLVASGAMSLFERLVLPVTTLFDLPPSLVGPISTYVVHPTAGLAFLSNLLAKQMVSEYHAIVALLAAGTIMIPVTRLRRTLPRYMAIYGVRAGAHICALTAAMAMFSRLVLLVGVVLVAG
jgi:hypothetical protein